MAVEAWKCPVCRRNMARPAAEGGVLVKSRYVRITPAGRLLMACSHCGSEAESIHGKLVLFRRVEKNCKGCLSPRADRESMQV